MPLSYHDEREFYEWAEKQDTTWLEINNINADRHDLAAFALNNAGGDDVADSEKLACAKRQFLSYLDDVSSAADTFGYRQ